MTLETSTGGLPLHGIRVVVTRARHQADALVRVFEAAGADVERLPLTEIVPPADPRSLDDAAAALDNYDWLVLTSVNAAEAFLPRIGTPPAKLQIAAVGQTTAQAIRRYGLDADLVPERFDSEGLVEALSAKEAAPGRPTRALWPKAEDARTALEQGLRTLGWQVTPVVAYLKALPEDAKDTASKLFDDATLGWVSFNSGTAVANFRTLFGNTWHERRNELEAVSIGPATSAVLREHGVEPVAEAERPEDASLVQAMVERVLGS